MKFDQRYFVLLILFFVIEVVIAIYVHDDFIRPYFGDFLAVVLMYCFVRSFFNLSVSKAAILAWLFSFFIEGLQYLKIVEMFGLYHSKIARTVIGSSFSWMDLLAYTAGIVTVVFTEKFYFQKQMQKSKN